MSKETNKVKIYTQEGCGHCKEVKEFFKENDIEFEEIDAGNDSEQEFLKGINAKFLPVTVIGDFSHDEFLEGRGFIVEGPEIEMIKDILR